jgi:hypothetical protein
MKKKYVIVSAILLSAGIFSFQNEKNGTIEKFHKLDSGGKIGSYAGAPTDQNCTACHNGTAQSGTSVNTVTLISGTTPVTTYTPGATYTVSLTMAPNPSKKGFQAVAMNSSNSIVGTATANVVGGTQIKTANRPTHKSTSNTSSNLAWVWNWVAPSTDVGNITIYVASMSANNNGNDDSGDVVYLSQHVFAADGSNNLEEVKKDKYQFKAGYSSTNNSIIMDFNSLISGQMYFNLVDLNGRSVFTYKMDNAQIGENHEKISLPEDLKDGMYVVNMFVNNNAMSQKIMIQK